MRRDIDAPFRKRDAATDQPLKQRSLLKDAFRRFLQNRLAMIGLVMLSLLVLVAALADIIAPYPLNYVDFSIVPLSPFEDPTHILGGDGVGRDFMTRLIYGARTSLLVGLVAPLISFGFAVPWARSPAIAAAFGISPCCASLRSPQLCRRCFRHVSHQHHRRRAGQCHLRAGGHILD